MSRTSRVLAFKLASLLEEYSEADFKEALILLRELGISSLSIDPLELHPSSGRMELRSAARVRTKPIQDITSRAVMGLRDIDPEKFRILAEFESSVRRGVLLASHEDVKRIGEKASKEFQPRRSRKESVSALMTVLAKMPIADVESLVAFAASLGGSADRDEYQRLAEFLIHGKGER